MYSISNFLNEISFNGLNTSKLINSEKFEILCITLEKGATLTKHSSPRDVHLLVLEGEINFHINSEVYKLESKQIFDFPKHEEHWVEALENSTFLVIR